MKLHKYFFLLLIIFFYGCSKTKQEDYGITNDSIARYLKLAENHDLSDFKSFSYNEKAFQLLQKQSNCDIERLFEVASNFYRLKRWPSYKKTSQLILQKALRAKYPENIIKSYILTGMYYYNIRAYDSAFYYFLKSERLCIKSNNKKYLAKAYRRKAEVQLYANDYLGADISISQAYNLSKSSVDKKFVYSVMSIMGSISNELKDYNKALEKHKETLNFITKHKLDDDENQEATVLNNIGNTYQNLNKDKQAIYYFENALNKRKELIRNPDLIAILIDNLAYSKFKLKKFQGLPELFHESLKISDSLKLSSSVVLSNIHLSEYYAIMKDSSKSMHYAKSAELASRNAKTPTELLESLKQLALIDHKNATLYTKQYIKIDDSLRLAERKSQNKIMRIQFETDDAISEKNEAVQQKWFFAAIASTLLVFGVLLFIIIVQRNKQKELLAMQKQQRTNEEIYELIQSQQSKMEEGKQIEKKRIAKDLHDGIMNRLTSTRLNLNILNERKDVKTIEACLPYIDNIQNIEKEIRDIAHDLNQDVFSSTDSFKAIVETLFEDQKNISQMNCHLEIGDDINWDLIEASKKIHIYRILQEALQNINKHSKAKNIIVSILNRNNTLLFEIYDDGIGFNIKNKKIGIGIQNIRSRVKDCDGTIDIRSENGAGTTIMISVLPSQKAGLFKPAS